MQINKLSCCLLFSMILRLCLGLSRRGLSPHSLFLAKRRSQRREKREGEVCENFFCSQFFARIWRNALTLRQIVANFCNNECDERRRNCLPFLSGQDLALHFGHEPLIRTLRGGKRHGILSPDHFQVKVNKRSKQTHSFLDRGRPGSQ